MVVKKSFKLLVATRIAPFFALVSIISVKGVVGAENLSNIYTVVARLFPLGATDNIKINIK